MLLVLTTLPDPTRQLALHSTLWAWTQLPVFTTLPDPTRPDPTTCHTVHFGRGPSLAWLTCSSTLHYAIRICIIDEYGLPHIDQLGFNSYLDQDRRVCLEPTYHAIFSPPSLEPSTHRPSSDIWIVDEAPWVMDS